MDTDKHTRIRVEETKHKQSDRNPFFACIHQQGSSLFYSSYALLQLFAN